MIAHGKDIKIFSGTSNRPLAEAICKEVGTELGNAEVGAFSDGENFVSIYETVRGSDVFVVQSTCSPVNDNLLEMLIMIDAFKRAFAADSKSAFGGIVAMNRECDKETAEEMKPIFFEVIMAPKFSREAVDVLSAKKNIRLVEVADTEEKELQLHKVSGGLLVQTPDDSSETRADCTCVTERAPTEEEWQALEFGWKIVKHVKSNAIVLTGKDITYGVGAGQMNRVGAADIAIAEAGEKCKGSIMASDAFFPFGDTIEAAGKAGITAVIQPGGSIRDQESIDMANKYGIAMVFTGHRHFRHS